LSRSDSEPSTLQLHSAVQDATPNSFVKYLPTYHTESSVALYGADLP
jgi:hypothetical protein